MRTILYVDDNLGKIAELKANLNINECNLITYSNPLKFAQEVGELNYDVLILDIMMPFLDGFSLYRKVTSMNNYKGQPVFFLSETRDEELMLNALQIGAGELLTPDMPWAIKRQRILNKLTPKDISKDYINDTNPYGLIVNKERLSVEKSGISVDLTHKEVLLFSSILENEDIAVNELVCMIWGNSIVMSGNNLATHLTNLNKKIKCFGVRARSKKGNLAIVEI